MKIKELRKITGLTQAKFAEMFEIPLATLRHWEQGLRVPPAYVVNMMTKLLEYKGYPV